MLHHCCKRDWHDRDNCADCLPLIRDIAEHHTLFGDGQTDPVRLNDGLEINSADTNGNDIGNNNAHQNRNDLEHAPAPDIADDDNGKRHDGKKPVLLAVIHRGTGKAKTDGNNNRAGYNGREKAHNFFYRENGKERSKNKINKASKHNAEICIRQHFRVWGAVRQQRRNSGIAAEESKGRAEKRGNFKFGYQMEKERAETRHQKRCLHIKPGEQRHQNGCSKHGERVLKTENQHSRSAKCSGIIDALFAEHGLFTFIFLCHRSSLRIISNKPARKSLPGVKNIILCRKFCLPRHRDRVRYSRFHLNDHPDRRRRYPHRGALFSAPPSPPARQ